MKSHTYMTAITERIPHRLSSTPQLTFGESLYVLDRSLEGYETVYNRCGPIYVNDEMIGFTPEGYAKVWVNEKFEYNHPSHPRGALQSTMEDSSAYLSGELKYVPTSRHEIDMVDNVVDVVSNHCEEGRFPEPFSSQIHLRNLGFWEARKLVQEYASANRINMPDRVDFYGKQGPVKHQPPPLHTPEPIHGYRFNYLPPERYDQPDIFASRVGEHGVVRGHRY